MAIVLYCSSCGRVVLVLRRIRPYKDIWEILVKRTGGSCPYCGARFTALDLRHVELSFHERFTRGMYVKNVVNAKSR